MSAPLPRYAAIRRDLETAILSGRWAPGDKIPSEHELVARYGCARMTVNKALSELVAAGLIVRHRRAGSFVATPSREESILEIHDIEAEANRDGKSYRFELMRRVLRMATADDAERLGVPATTSILALDSIHHVAGTPYATEDRLINVSSVPAACDVDFSATSAGSWLLAQMPWTRARHRISAVNVKASQAHALRIAPGTACLAVERATWLQNRPITHVRLVYPGERHHLLAHFSPSNQGR